MSCDRCRRPTCDGTSRDCREHAEFLETAARKFGSLDWGPPVAADVQRVFDWDEEVPDGGVDPPETEP